MTTMIFYNKIVPLNRDNHRKLRLKSSDGKAGFTANTHYVPLASSEFFQAARDYPVLFANDANGGPIALLGLQKGSNLFLQDDGAWLEGTYVPAFVRRYPFILARGEDKNNLTVCMDESFSGFGETEGTPLFDENGNDSAYLTGIVDFLNRFTADMEATRDFIKRLNELQLLASRNLRITDSRGRNFMLNDFRIVDETKLAALDDATLGDLHRRGWLGWIYAHLVSLGNVNRLPGRVVTGVVTDSAKAGNQIEVQAEEPEADKKRRKKGASASTSGSGK